MSTVPVVFPDLLKAHIDTYTRKDGVVVQAHDDKRSAGVKKNNAVSAKKPKDVNDLYMNTTHAAHKELISHVESLKKKGYQVVNQHHETNAISDDNSAASRSLHSMYFMKHPDGSKAVAYRIQNKAFNGGDFDDRHYQDVGVKYGGDLPEQAKQKGKIRALSGNVWSEASNNSPMQKSIMSNTTLIVFPELLKAHVAGYTRKDGVFVKEHDDKRAAASPDAVKQHAVAAGAKHGSGVSVFSKPEAAHSFASRAAGSKGGAFVMSHPDHGHHVVVNGADSQRMEKNGYKHAPLGGDKPAAAPAEFGVHHSDLKEGDHLYDKDGQKVDEVEGFSRGINSPKVHTRAGYTHGTRSDGFLPGLSNKKPGAEPAKSAPRKAAPKTGSAAPARMTNVGSEKYPLLAKTSGELPTKHADGSTHHVGGFEPPSNGKGDHLVQHDRKLYSFTGKSGKNMKTGEASYEYSHQSDSGDRRAWVTHSGHLMND